MLSAYRFECRKDTELGNGKRWVTVARLGGETVILLAHAIVERQPAEVDQQGGGGVWLFLEAENFRADHAHMLAAGISFDFPSPE